VLVAADVGHTVRVQESATNAGGTGGPASSTQTAVVAPQNGPPQPPSNTSPPVISGAAIVGHTLTASTGDWSGTPPLAFAYHWQRCNPGCQNIRGATGRSYVLTADDLNARVHVIVTASNSAGTADASSRQVGPIVSGPKSAQVQALLSRALAPHGVTIGGMLVRGGYSLTFSAPTSGRLTVRAQLISTGRHHHAAVLVAKVVVRFPKAGAAKVRMILTRNGRQLLENASNLKLTVTGTFRPSQTRSTSVTKTFMLRR
jgi:hypothetical protein